MSGAPDDRLDLVGIGSMVVDRVHRAPRILRTEEKGILRAVGEAGPVAVHVGGVVLNHLGWAAALGLRAGICGRQAADGNGRFLRGAMQRLGIARDIRLEGSASSFAEIFVDDAGERANDARDGVHVEHTSRVGNAPRGEQRRDVGVAERREDGGDAAGALGGVVDNQVG